MWYCAFLSPVQMIEYPQGQWAMQPNQPDEMVAIQIADPVEDAMVVDEEIRQLPAEGKFYQRLRAFDSQGRPYEVITCVQLPQDPGSEDPEELVSFVKALARSLEALQQQVSQQFDALGAAVWEGIQVDTFLVKQVAELQQQMAAAHQACLDRARGEERCEESCAALSAESDALGKVVSTVELQLGVLSESWSCTEQKLQELTDSQIRQAETLAKVCEESANQESRSSHLGASFQSLYQKVFESFKATREATAALVSDVRHALDVS